MLKPLSGYIGGKQKFLNDILPVVPEHNRYVEVFFGQGSVFFAKRKSHSNIINDLDHDVYNFFRVLQKYPDIFINEINQVPYSAEYFEKTRLSFKDKKIWADMLDFDRAVNYFILLFTSFSSVMNSGSLTRRESNWLKWADRLPEHIRLVANHLREDTYITNFDFEKCIESFDDIDTFFFIDPPYTMAKKGKYYRMNFDEQDHERLRDCLKKIKGKFLLTYDNNELIRKLYTSPPFMIKKIQMTAVSAVTGVGGQKPTKEELFIYNYAIQENLFYDSVQRENGNKPIGEFVSSEGQRNVEQTL
jgi:DNA adenine methylase